MSDLNENTEMTKEEFAANEIRAFCEHVMHLESDLHKDAEWWINERLQANGDNKEQDKALHLRGVVFSEDCDQLPTNVLEKHLDSLKTAEAHEQVSARKAIESEDINKIEEVERNLQHFKQQILLFEDALNAL